MHNRHVGHEYYYRLIYKCYIKRAFLIRKRLPSSSKIPLIDGLWKKSIFEIRMIFIFFFLSLTFSPTSRCPKFSQFRTTVYLGVRMGQNFDCSIFKMVTTDRPKNHVFSAKLGVQHYFSCNISARELVIFLSLL